MKFANNSANTDGKAASLVAYDGPCVFFSLHASFSGSAGVVMLFDARTLPRTGDRPKRQWSITELTTFDHELANGRPMQTGCVVALSSTMDAYTAETTNTAIWDVVFYIPPADAPPKTVPITAATEQPPTKPAPAPQRPAPASTPAGRTAPTSRPLKGTVAALLAAFLTLVCPSARSASSTTPGSSGSAGVYVKTNGTAAAVSRATGLNFIDGTSTRAWASNDNGTVAIRFDSTGSSSGGSGNGTLTSTNLQPVLVIVNGDSQSTSNYAGYGKAWSDFLKARHPWTNFQFTNIAANFRTASNNVVNWQSREGALSLQTNSSPHSSIWFGWFGYADLISGHAPADIINNLSNGMVLARRAGSYVVVPTIQQGGGSAQETNTPVKLVTTNRWAVNNWLRTVARTNQLYDKLVDVETIFTNSVGQYNENYIDIVYDQFDTNWDLGDPVGGDATHWNSLAMSNEAVHIASNVLSWATQPLGIHGGTIRGPVGLTIEGLTGTGHMVAADPAGKLFRTNATAGGSAGYFTNSQTIAYVATNGNDATAVISVEQLPFLTVSNAIIAIRTNGGMVKIGAGRFLSPPRTLLVTDHTNNPGTNRLVIEGSGRVFPTTNNNFSTLVADGRATILEGPFLINRPRVEVTDLCIDSGKVVCTNLFSAAAQEGLLWYTFQQELWTTNTLNLNAVAKRITVLGYETNAAAHALVMENVVDGVMEDIWTCGNTHGVVIKGFRVHASRITAQGHSSNGFIIKANDYAAPGLRAGYEGTGIDGSGSVSVSGLAIRPLRVYGDTPGLRLDTLQSSVAHMSAINVAGYFYHGAGSMVMLDSQATWIIAGVRIDCASYKWGTGAGTIAKTGTLAEVFVNGASQ